MGKSKKQAGDIPSFVIRELEHKNVSNSRWFDGDSFMSHTRRQEIFIGYKFYLSWE
jgi:hypothetical protein